MKIVIIDDDKSFMEELKTYLITFVNNYSLTNFQIECINDVTDLSNIDDVACFFIDIEIGNINGIELSMTINNQNNQALIIFISNYGQYVFDTFSVSPFTFLLKSDYKARLMLEKNRFIRQLKNIDKTYYGDFKSSNNDFFSLRLQQKNIKYVEKEKESFNCIFHYNNIKLKQHINLKNILCKLCDDFIQINKAIIINMNFIKEIKNDEILLNDDETLFISRRKRNYFLQRYYLFLEDK